MNQLLHEDDDEERYWLVVFKEGQSPIFYKNKTSSQMVDVVAKYYNRHNGYPFGIWVFEDRMMKKVEIAS